MLRWPSVEQMDRTVGNFLKLLTNQLKDTFLNANPSTICNPDWLQANLCQVYWGWT